MANKPIAVGSDHAGYRLKEAVKRYLKKLNLPIKDYGPENEDRVDYPEYGVRVGRAVVSKKSDRGIIMCGSGIGISIAANKVKGVRAALCHNVNTAYLSRAHNDANILALGGRLISERLARTIVKKFLETPFEGGRHTRRVRMINKI